MQGGGGSHWEDPMRIPGLSSGETRSEQNAAGFSLLELLVSLAFLTVLTVTLLQSLTYCLQVSNQTQKHWNEALSRWNQVQEIRGGRDMGGDPVVVKPEARPMFLSEIASQNAKKEKWGVLRGTN